MSAGAKESEDEILGKAYDARLMGRVWPFAVPHARVGLAAIGLTVALAALRTATPYLLGVAVDAIVALDMAWLWRIAWWLLALEACAFVVTFGQEYALALCGQRILLDLRMTLFERVSRQSLAYLSRHPVGRLVTRVMNDTQAIAELFTTGIVASLGDLLAIVFAAAVMLKLDVKLSLATFTMLPLLVIVTFATRGRIRQAFRDIRQLLARINATIAESVQGMSVIQLFGRERATLERYAALERTNLDASLRQIHWEGLFSSGVTVLTLGAVALLVWLGGEAALAGGMSIGVLVAFLGYAQRLFQPIRDMADKYQIFQAAMASAERIFQVLDAPDEVPDPVPARPLPSPVAGAVELRGVQFRYPELRGKERLAALTGVDIRIEPGEMVAVVGHTGAGKSSIVNLLARFYDPQEGDVLLDGVPVRELEQRALRQQIGVVLQDVFIFTGTVLDNIRLGSAISEERCREAARAVGADAFIEALPGGYQHLMRERGATLSVGQKQLISFARALAHDPRVLVLDEATSSVDPETERRLQEAVGALTRGRTAIVIAHRLATIRDADRVLVLHKGEVREEGTLEALLAERGLFYTLYRLQYPDAS